MHLAANYPHLTRGIFLEDPPIILPGEKFGSEEQVINVEEIGKMMARFMLVFKLLPGFIGTRLARKMSPTYPDDEIIPWINAKKRVSFDFLASMTALDMDLAAPFEVIGKIRVPILLFIGDKEKMSIMSKDAAQKASEANEKLRVAHLEGASHDIRRTRFDGYMPALRDFLASILLRA
jgi:N-formylmaleamate deformylase